MCEPGLGLEDLSDQLAVADQAGSLQCSWVDEVQHRDGSLSGGSSGTTKLLEKGRDQNGVGLGPAGTAAVFEAEGSRSRPAECQASSWGEYWRWISVYLILGP